MSPGGMDKEESLFGARVDVVWTELPVLQNTVWGQTGRMSYLCETSIIKNTNLSFHLFLYLAATIIFVTNLEKIQQRYNVVYKYYIQGCTRLANQLPHPSFFFYFPLYMYFFLVKILLGSCYPQHHHHHLHHHWDYHHFFSDSIIPKSISCT